MCWLSNIMVKGRWLAHLCINLWYNSGQNLVQHGKIKTVIISFIIIRVKQKTINRIPFPLRSSMHPSQGNGLVIEWSVLSHNQIAHAWYDNGLTNLTIYPTKHIWQKMWSVYSKPIIDFLRKQENLQKSVWNMIYMYVSYLRCPSFK